MYTVQNKTKQNWLGKACRGNQHAIFFLCLIGTAFLALVIIGAYFLHIGLEAGEGNWENDFVAMGAVCTITKAHHQAQHSQGGHGSGHCYDVWSYSFTTNSGTEEYLSTTEDEHRRDGDCSEGQVVPGTLREGQQNVECWSPKVNPPPEWYRCANSKCYKIIHPAVDESEARAWKAGKILVGQICFGIAALVPLSFCVCFCISLKDAYCNKNRKTWHEERKGRELRQQQLSTAVGMAAPEGENP